MSCVNTAVVRVKRHHDEEPLDALVLACKRRKNEASSEEDNPFTTILKFAGTVKNQEENVADHITSFKKDVKAMTQSRTTPTITLITKRREENRKSTEESRYKVVSGFRALKTLDTADPSEATKSEDTPEAKDDLKNKHVLIMDIEDSKPVREVGSDDSYVYDLYYTGDGTADFDDALLDQMVSVRPLPYDLVYRNRDSDSEHADDDQDSNDENNPGNEYPDTEDSMSRDDEDEKLVLELGCMRVMCEELSSDDEDEGYLAYGDLDPIDLERYGQGYASYKARLNKELCCYSDQSDSDNE